MHRKKLANLMIWEMLAFGEQDKIGNHTFPITWVVFAHPIPILCDISSYGKCMGFPINLP